MTEQLTRYQVGGGIQTFDVPLEPEYRVLDVYAGGVADEEPRIEAIATISAGAKDENGNPIRSRDGRIYLHDANGRAPGLQDALQAGDGKRLTIAFPSDDVSKIVQQRFAAYSRTALLAYGTEHAMTVLEGGRRTVDAPSVEYDRWLAKCKVQASFYFCLSGWDGNAPYIDFPDGLGYYRLRTTSRNSIRSLLSSLHNVAKFTGGRLAGVPFELSIEQRDVAGQDGKRQKVPVWVMVLRTPTGMRLTSRSFAMLATQALAEGASLMLPAPSPENYEMAIAEAGTALVVSDDELAITDDEAEMLSRGGACDEAYWCKRWFATVKGTPIDTDAARASYLLDYTEGRFDSLKAFLAQAIDGEAAALLESVENTIELGEYDWLAQAESDAIEGELVDSESTEIPAMEELDGGHIRRNGATLDEKSLTSPTKPVEPETPTNNELKDWAASVRLRCEKAVTTKRGAGMPVTGDVKFVREKLLALVGGSSTLAKQLLADLTHPTLATSNDLRMGEAEVLRVIIATEADELRRYADLITPQGALL